MIQRIQSIYLALAILSLGLTYVFPFASYVLADATYIFGISGVYFDGARLNTIPFHVIVPLLILVLAVTLLIYKKRPVQVRLGRLSYILLLALVVLVYLQVDDVLENFKSTEEVRLVFGLSTFLPVIALVFIFLANRAIRKDEELVKSVDRLR